MLTDVLARGGMAVVYRAHQRSANRVVALKMILAGTRGKGREVSGKTPLVRLTD